MTSGQHRGPPEADPPPQSGVGGHYWARVGDQEIFLGEQETLVGRGEACQIVVRDALVSRRHARLFLERGRLFIEDLDSANGTFVNQARLHGRAQLFPGDHVFVGTAELEIQQHEEGEDRPTMPGDEDLARPTPSSGVRSFQPGSTAAPSSGTARARAAATEPPLETTTDIDGLEYLGRLADKMFTMGRVDAARKILSTHLEDVLSAVRKGDAVAPSVIDTAGRYAVKLAHETLDAHWVNVAIETHLHAHRPLSEETLQQLAALRAKAPMGDEALIRRYYMLLRSLLLGMSPAERLLVERVGCLIPGLDGS